MKTNLDSLRIGCMTQRIGEKKEKKNKKNRKRYDDVICTGLPSTYHSDDNRFDDSIISEQQDYYCLHGIENKRKDLVCCVNIGKAHTASYTSKLRNREKHADIGMQFVDSSIRDALLRSLFPPRFCTSMLFFLHLGSSVQVIKM